MLLALVFALVLAACSSPRVNLQSDRGEPLSADEVAALLEDAAVNTHVVPPGFHSSPGVMARGMEKVDELLESAGWKFTETWSLELDRPVWAISRHVFSCATDNAGVASEGWGVVYVEDIDATCLHEPTAADALAATTRMLEERGLLGTDPVIVTLDGDDSEVLQPGLDMDTP
ncbi:hypothetical protein [Oerskovia sp. Root22]|uniref:hypothetical protein n=1 Tax=Oerskovia sp. Root22 TaxID=1736494 RepID=UPI000B2B2267|nr:hypothetical protein [Oerskovia sp. Root22]